METGNPHLALEAGIKGDNRAVPQEVLLGRSPSREATRSCSHIAVYKQVVLGVHVVGCLVPANESWHFNALLHIFGPCINSSHACIAKHTLHVPSCLVFALHFVAFCYIIAFYNIVLFQQH